MEPGEFALESTADAVGAFVDWVLNESGWTIERLAP